MSVRGTDIVEPLITPRELLPHLEDPDWVVVDCSFDLSDPGLGESQYRQAHIPGAVFADLERDLSRPPDGKNGRHPLPSPDELARLFSALGIDRRTTAVAYDRSGSPYASRFWWSLRYVGGRNVAVLDGGLEAWTAAGYPVQAGAEERPPARFVPSVDTSIHVTAAQLEAGLGRGQDLLLDARAPERYRGEQEPLDPVAGHIPGAVNVFWQDNLDEHGRFQSPERLRARYERLMRGRSPSTVVAYCGSGVTGCHLLLAMAHAGIDGGRLYAGSWSEWSSDPARPVAVGEEPEAG